MSRRSEYALNLKKKKMWVEIKPNMDLIDDSTVEYVIYARKSTDDDVNQKQSIPDQIRACINYVERNREKWGKQITIMKKNELFDKYFKDDLGDIKEARKLHISDQRFYEEVDDLFIIKESASAKNPGRPKWDALIKLVEKWQIKWILSYSPDRQARNMIDWWLLIELATIGKVKLLYTNFLFENSPSGRMMLGIWFVYSKFYSDNLSHITTRWNISATERWKALGKIKHGYNINEHGEYVPNEWHWMIRQAFEARLYTNATNKEIADKLMAEWYMRVTKESKREITYDWDDISNWRTDPFYYGKLTYADEVAIPLQDKYDFVSMINEDEHNLLCEKYLKDRRWVKINKDETDLTFVLNPFEPQFVRSSSWNSLSMYVSKKPAMEKRVITYIDSWKKFRYIDIVPKSYLRYKASGKFEVTYQEIEPQIIKRLQSIKVDKNTYETYVKYVTEDHKIRNNEIAVKRKTFTDQQERVENEKRKYRANAIWFGIMNDDERKTYDERIRDFENQIKKIHQYLDELYFEENTEYIEYESFIQIVSNAAKYYELWDTVRRRKIISILSSNLIINDDKSVTIRVKPSLEWLFLGMVGDEGFEPTTPSV